MRARRGSCRGDRTSRLIPICPDNSVCRIPSRPLSPTPSRCRGIATAGDGGSAQHDGHPARALALDPLPRHAVPVQQSEMPANRADQVGRRRREPRDSTRVQVAVVDERVLAGRVCAGRFVPAVADPAPRLLLRREHAGTSETVDEREDADLHPAPVGDGTSASPPQAAAGGWFVMASAASSFAPAAHQTKAADAVPVAVAVAMSQWLPRHGTLARASSTRSASHEPAAAAAPRPPSRSRSIWRIRRRTASRMAPRSTSRGDRPRVAAAARS